MTSESWRRFFSSSLGLPLSSWRHPRFMTGVCCVARDDVGFVASSHVESKQSDRRITSADILLLFEILFRHKRESRLLFLRTAVFYGIYIFLKGPSSHRRLSSLRFLSPCPESVSCLFFSMQGRGERGGRRREPFQ